MAENPDERLARHIVSKSLGVPVRRFEDGRAPSQVDAMIEYGEGRTAPLEIVADHEAAFNRQWDALAKTEFKVTVPGLRRVWSAQLARTAVVKRVAMELPALVLRWEEETVRQDARQRTELPEEFDRLGVTMLYPMDDPHRSGYVNLHAAGWSSFSGSESMASYVARILDEQADVPRKLAAHRTSGEAHAFIWSTIGTVWGVQSQLERREQPLPDEDPELPEGVTHVWVGGSFSSQGTLAWFPDRGWWRSPFEWPEDGALVLDD